ncbi:hypothetical protein WALSEDRAFT_60804 [Wallemia mellicola CBS 633.66]|uniref:SMP-LTD domain-containing protein n=1 Tax=Wallemia mellicola (strain ATCC MYA-4683 / CBS 633.66) TaxID=671144 RepID=I4Y9Q0_WALMC|nr:hypothetical protein WALSEDRAFT_60804 [Wallemia mellicola CBS 633.66]EIM20692.1 hypothetical protein WALSEDRAFT_60804 [Wallemia mellicola CBS 633.66]|eukprot:XP_006959225.1 hypothetical protein WALSEDRAFT_60804 [Wallemia mellicola CBS 633.66]
MKSRFLHIYQHRITKAVGESQNMTDYKLLAQVYFLGGITFLPLLAILSISFFMLLAPRDKNETKKLPKNPNQDAKVSKSGWLHIKRDFEVDPTLSVDESYTSMIIAGYRSWVEHKDVQHRPRPKARHMFWAVLKARTLYVYQDESCDEIVIALNMESINVDIHPEGLLDAELFTKRTAIKLTIDYDQGVLLDEKEKESSNGESGDVLDVTNKVKPFYIHAMGLVEYEDWYHALNLAKDPTSNPYTEPSPAFIIEDMKRLVNNIDNDPDPIPTRWFNALLGRYFFAIYRTQWLEDWIIGRIMKKLKVVKRPKFLTNIMVTEANLGDMPPTFSKPVLKELTKEGDASVEVHVSFKGCVKITLTATATLNLGNRLKSYSVDLVLAVVLRSLEGNMIIKMKKPPSNRIWYGFTEMPEMELDVEPVVEDRKVKWNMVLSTIKDKLREMIQEGLVLPSMDDIAFFDTTNEIHRGGIYAETTRLPGTKQPQNRPPSIKERDQELLEHGDKKESTAPQTLDGTDLPSGLPGINLESYEKESREDKYEEPPSTTSTGSTSSKTKSWFNEKFNKESWLENLKNNHHHHHPTQSSLADGSASLIGKHLKKKKSGEVSVTQSDVIPSPSAKSEKSDKLSVKSETNVPAAASTSSSPSSYSVSSKESVNTSTPSSTIDAIKASPKVIQAKDAFKKLNKKTKSNTSLKKDKKIKHQRSQEQVIDPNEVPKLKPAEKLNERMQISRSQPVVGLNLSNETGEESNESRRRSSVTTPPKASPMMAIPGIPNERKSQSNSSLQSMESPPGSIYRAFSSPRTSHNVTSSVDSNNSMNEEINASLSSSPISNRSSNSRTEQLLSRIRTLDQANRTEDKDKDD